MKVHLIYGEQLFNNPMLDVELPCLPQVGSVIVFDVDFDDKDMEKTNDKYHGFMTKVDDITKEWSYEYEVISIMFRLPDTTPYIHLKQVV